MLISHFTFSATLWDRYHRLVLQINKLRLRDINEVCSELPSPKCTSIFRISTWPLKAKHVTVFVLQLYSNKWQGRLKAAYIYRILTQARHDDLHTCTLPHQHAHMHTPSYKYHAYILIPIYFLKMRTQSFTEDTEPTHAHIARKKWSGFTSRLIWCQGSFHGITPRDGGWVEVDSASCLSNVSSSILSY